MTTTESRTVHPAFEAVAAKFASFVDEDPAYSAQLVIWHHGEPVVDITGGPALDRRSLTGVFSATKGVAAIVIARLLDAGDLDLERRVADYWPEFAASGKGECTVGQLLSHQAGLPLAGRTLDIAELTDPAAAALLASQQPLWVPGSCFGYHAVTIGILMEELVRRVTGTTLQELYEQDIRRPLDADFYLGLPPAEEHRYIAVREVQPTSAQKVEIAARPPQDAIASGVFSNVRIADGYVQGPGLSTNIPELRQTGPAGIGGVGSARGLAVIYAATLASAAKPIASTAVFEAMAVQRSWGIDRVLNVANSFGAVFMLPQPRMPYGGLRAYGHDGAGGALAFADPSTQIAFGYVPAPMQYPGGADVRSVELARLTNALASTR